MSTNDITLTLPGTIPGLLRRCSPVRVLEAGDNWDAIVTQVVSRRKVAFIERTRGNEWPLAMFALDLTDATGRAHATWWLAGQHVGIPWLGRALFELDFASGPTLVLGVGSHVMNMWGDACAGLDPNDPRRLHDGSRRVDAEALRLVCLRVAAMASEPG